MAIANQASGLSLDEYAAEMGINPVHFNQGVLPSTDPVLFPQRNPCDSVFLQRGWQQADEVGREEIARQLANAERLLANQIGFDVSPTYQLGEVIPLPRNASTPLVRTAYSRVIALGRKTVSSLGSVTPVYSDEDGDNWSETATLTVSSTADVSQIRVYFYGHAGEDGWEIRPFRSITSDGSTITITLDSWLLIDPDLWFSFPTSAGEAGINISTVDNFVTSVAVVEISTSSTSSSPAVVAYWKTSTGTVGYDTQNIHATIESDKLGVLRLTPAGYDADTGLWSHSSWSKGRLPDFVKVWYLAGDSPVEWRLGTSAARMQAIWKRRVAYLATANLPRSICSCGSATALVERMRTDMALRTPDGVSHTISFDDLTNPFGTRLGQLMVWKEIEQEGYILPLGGLR